MFELDQGHNGIVENAVKLRFDPFSYPLFLFLLEGSYPAGLDEDLVRQGSGSKYPPRSSVIVKFIGKDPFGFVYDRIEGFFCARHPEVFDRTRI